MDDRQTVFRDHASGQHRQVLGMRHCNKLLPGESGYLLLEANIPPGAGAPPHAHDIDAECFFILAGELTLIDEQGERTARTGDTCFLPPGRTHGFINRGSGDVRALVIVTPGDAAVAFFDAMHQLAASDALDEGAVMESAGRHGITIGPPAAAA